MSSTPPNSMSAGCSPQLVVFPWLIDQTLKPLMWISTCQNHCIPKDLGNLVNDPMNPFTPETPRTYPATHSSLTWTLTSSEYPRTQDIVFQDHSLQSKPAKALWLHASLSAFLGRDLTTRSEMKQGRIQGPERRRKQTSQRITFTVGQPNRWQRKPGNHGSGFHHFTPRVGNISLSHDL